MEAEQNPKDGKNNHKLTANLRKLQAVTGLVIAAFTSLHLSNHFAMHFGLEAHQAVFRIVRKLYTQPIAESILWLSIAIHAILGLIRYKGVSKETSRLLFQLSGWYLMMVMPGHITATRVMGQRIGMKEYDVTQAAMAARLIPKFFIPYYVVMSMSGAYHMYQGLGKSGAILGIESLSELPQSGNKFVWISSVLCIASASSALAISGVYFSYPMVEEALIIKDALKMWPRSVSKHIVFPGPGEWFASWK